MNYMDFAPYLIRERNEQVQREVDSLRLEERLREDRGRGSSGSRLVALATNEGGGVYVRRNAS